MPDNKSNEDFNLIECLILNNIPHALKALERFKMVFTMIKSK